MATKKSSEPASGPAVPAGDTDAFTVIALDLLHGLVGARHSDAHTMDLIARALSRVKTLAESAEG